MIIPRDPADWTVLHTDGHDSIRGITDLARRHLIERAGPEMVSIVITAPDGRLYPFAQGGQPGDDAAVIAARADDMIYQIQALLHWDADHPGMAG